MNFGELTALIADDLVDERLSNVQIQNAINQAIKFYGRKTFYFNTVKAIATTVPRQEYYAAEFIGFHSTLPRQTVDMYSIQTIRYNNSEISVALRPLEDSTIENVSPIGPGYLFPQYYAYAQTNIRLFPVPQEVGTLTILATYKYPALTEDTEVSVFLLYADELIRQAAKRYLSYNVLHDSALGDRCAAMEAEEFASLRAETMAREPVVPMRAPSDLVALATATDVYDIVLDQ